MKIHFPGSTTCKNNALSDVPGYKLKGIWWNQCCLLIVDPKVNWQPIWLIWKSYNVAIIIVLNLLRMVDSLGYPPISSTMVSPFQHNVCFSITLKKSLNSFKLQPKKWVPWEWKHWKAWQSRPIRTYKNPAWCCGPVLARLVMIQTSL